MAVADGRSEGLDSLRFLAILAVLFDHFAKLEAFQPGQVSVRFFLLLSGFLITRTLHRHAGAGWARNRVVLKAFYLRRSLRIWPLYYVVLALLFAAGAVTRPQLLVHAAFVTDFAQALANDWNIPWPLAHVWTLCVQEQFYLVWPLAFLWLGSRRGRVLAALIVAAVVFRCGMWLAGRAADVAFFTLPLAAFDALAVGALLALHHQRLRQAARHAGPLVAILAALCGALCLLADDNPVRVCLLPTLWLAPLGWLTLRAFDGLPGVAGQVLRWPPLVFFGRISLGVYLLHLPVYYAAGRLSPTWLLDAFADRPLATFAVLTALTLPTAVVSWAVLEKPLQRFRKWAPYDAAPAARPGGARVSAAR